MKCPKCGYNSFDHLDSCKKCNTDLSEHKVKFNLRGFFFPDHKAATVSAPPPETEEDSAEAEQPDDDTVDFGFDFLDEDAPVAKNADKIALGKGSQDISIDQPFGADSETIPADPFADEDEEPRNKPAKGPEFAF